jgi:fatty acid desaturase
MMGDHKAALAALRAGRIAALSETSNMPGLIRLASHLGLLSLSGAAILAVDGWVRLPLQFLHGTALVFLFSAAHECIHRTAFRTRWLNDAVAWGAGLVLILPPNAFRYFHFAHHRHTQDAARDPELATPKPRTRGEYFLRLTGWGYWTGQIRALAAAAGAPLPLPLTLWLIPVVLGQPMLRAFLLAEHTGCPLVPDMLANSRTTFAHRAIRWLAWEMPWHTAHHAAPTVPFHRLGKLTAEIESALKCTAQGYLDAQGQILRAIGAHR